MGEETETLNLNQAWWLTSIIPAFGRLRQKDQELKASKSYTVTACLKKTKKKKKKKETL
jgi:hypothetical protein